MTLTDILNEHKDKFVIVRHINLRTKEIGEESGLLELKNNEIRLQNPFDLNNSHIIPIITDDLTKAEGFCIAELVDVQSRTVLYKNDAASATYEQLKAQKDEEKRKLTEWQREHGIY